jgi:dihydrofolate synthase/folylpolyglutamate synthase
MNYNETLKYLYGRLPMFQRVGAAAYKADLGNTLAVCRLLGNPEKDFPAVHIAGTNGKGSTAAMIASVLKEAGFKTALFTSPHLVDFRERIRIDGEMISKDYVVDFVEKYGKPAEETGASFFELTFGMAMKYFSDRKVDIAVVEVGMGGRLDSTNVVKPLVSVITNISFDHTAFLGNTLEKIAGEKAGIIKEGVPVVVGRRQPATEKVFAEVATKNNAPLFYAADLTDIKTGGGISYSFGDEYHSLDMPLKGDYQKENLRTALSALLLLSAADGYEKITDKILIYNGIKNIHKNTGFAGRWQIKGQNPLIIFDTGHNADGLRITMKQLLALQFEKLHMVIGMVNDKNTEEVFSLMPANAVYYFCKADIPRGLPAGELQERAAAAGLQGSSYPSVQKAFEAAKAAAAKDDVIFVGGSTFVVAEVLQVDKF